MNRGNGADSVAKARAAIGTHVRRTPCELSRTLSSLCNCELYLKFENLQFTASFKERGALNRLLALNADERARGVICMSAGNHAQAVAYHAKRLGIRSTIVMPRFTPNAKVQHTKDFADEVILHGATFDESRQLVEKLVVDRRTVLVHPYDDVDVIAGQGTMTAEILEQVPELEVLVVPIGGGGLISGAALAIEQGGHSGIELIGVQAERYPGAYQRLKSPQSKLPQPLGTIAEGIAVKTPGERTLEIMSRRVDDVLLVSETEIEDAMAMLLDIEKSVTEGAGAAALAAVIKAGKRWKGKRVCAVVSGGNVDPFVMSVVIQRHMVRSGQLVRVRIELPDVPGAIGDVARLLGELDSNIVEIEHHRDFASSSVKSVVVEFILQLRGEEEAERIQDALRDRGYEAAIL